MQVLPYKEKETAKKEQVAEMFDNIAGKYDFLNHFLSMGIDIRWRKKAVGILAKRNPKKVLDIATGTGDFAIEAVKKCKNLEQAYGVDISKGMLEVGKEKVKKLKYENILTLEYGDSENLQFEDNTFDGITVAFGVRNFENLEKGLSEMYRVLKPGGIVIVLEFSKPERFPVKQSYQFYFKYILPRIGRVVSKDSSAYTYLPESVNAFPYGERFNEKLRGVGFKDVKCKPLTLGISSIYTGIK